MLRDHTLVRYYLRDGSSGLVTRLVYDRREISPLLCFRYFIGECVAHAYFNTAHSHLILSPLAHPPPRSQARLAATRRVALLADAR